MRNDDTITFIEGLARSLEPIRNAFLAQALFVLFESGLYDELTRGPQQLEELSRELQMRADRLEALLQFALHEGLVIRANNGYSPAAKLGGYARHRSWYQLFIGGYGKTLLDGTALLKKESVDHGDRDLVFVGRGSTGISSYDTIPLVTKLLPLAGQVEFVVDLGSSDAAYLLELCKADPMLQGLAVEPVENNAVRARGIAREHGLGDRIKVLNASFQAYVERPAKNADCYILAFVLQEVVAQEGIDYLVAALTRLRQSEKAVHLLVIEVNAAVPPGTLDDGLGRSYYNPYILLHSWTKQILLSRSDWLEIFHSCGYEVVAEASPSIEVDPTGLEIAFLLRGSTSDCRKG